VRRKAFDEGEDPGVLPIDGADNFLGDPSVAVNDVGLGKFERAETRGQRLLGVARDREGQVIVRDELFERRGVFIHADADHGDALRPGFEGEFFQAGRFFDARRTPGGPEIQDHNLPAVIRQRQRTAIESGNRKLRRSVTDRDARLIARTMAQVKGQSSSGKQQDDDGARSFAHGLRVYYNIELIRGVHLLKRACSPGWQSERRVPPFPGMPKR
jgi:hypothetical protein